MNFAQGFDTAAQGVAWTSIMMRVAQFLFFSSVAMWRRVTFGALAAMIFALALTSGIKM